MERLQPDDNLLYDLSHYRRLPPSQRVAFIDIHSPSFYVARYIENLSDDIETVGEVSEPFRDLQAEIYQLADEISGCYKYLRENISSDQADKHEQIIIEFRQQSLPLLDKLLVLATQLDEQRPIVEAEPTEALTWTQGILRLARTMWLNVEVLTNPTLQVPSYITDWMDIEKEVIKQAKAGDRRVVPTLVNTLENPVSDIRKCAAWLLEYVPDERAVQPLLKCLDDSDSDVREYTIDTLRKWHDPRAIQPLIDCMLIHRENRWPIVRALSEIPDQRALHPILTCLEEEMQTPKPLNFFDSFPYLKDMLKIIGGTEAEQAIRRYFP